MSLGFGQPMARPEPDRKIINSPAFFKIDFSEVDSIHSTQNNSFFIRLGLIKKIQAQPNPSKRFFIALGNELRHTRPMNTTYSN